MTKISIKNAGDAPRWNLKRVGGNSGRGLYVDLEVLAGNGLRQGAVAIVVERPDGEDFVWDGNPDAGLKVTIDNEAANADNEGALRGIDVKAQNWGDHLSWLHGGNINARHSGDRVYEIQGIGTRVENYADVMTSILGIDVNLSDEDKGGGHTLHGIRVRNTDQSAQAAADAAFLISHTSTNGFAAMLEAAAATGDGFVASVATPNGNAAFAGIIEIAGTLYYFPLYTAVGFGG